jgi:hypothetical protein
VKVAHAIVATALALASTGAAARADEPRQPIVWYRSSAGCPDGAAFLASLERRGLRGRIATLGDRVDFVVTLSAELEIPSGRLERQTDAGTVAVRQLTAATCDEVADGIALSLALTFQPNSGPSSEVAPAPSDVPVNEADHAHTQVASSSSPTEHDRAAHARPARSDNGAWAVGADGVISTGIAPSLLLGAGLFGERAFASQGLLRPSVRLSIFAAQSSSETQRGDLVFQLGNARVEGCPIALGVPTLQFRPCAGGDVGIASAAGSGPSGMRDTNAWADLVAHARVTWTPLAALQVEVQIGAIVPLTRYEIAFSAPTEIVHRTASIGLASGIGAAFRWE